MKNLFFFLMIVFAAVSAGYGQRCGSAIQIVFFQKDGKLVENNKNFKIKLLIDNNPISIKGREGNSLQNENPKFIRLRTGCGLHLTEFEIVYKKQKMRLIIHKIPMDFDFSIEAPNFTKGSFAIDFGFDYPDSRSAYGKLEDKEYKQKKGDIIRFNNVVSSQRWTKTK